MSCHKTENSCSSVAVSIEIEQHLFSVLSVNDYQIIRMYSCNHKSGPGLSTTYCMAVKNCCVK